MNLVMMMMAEMPMSFISSARQSIEDNDSVPVDTVLQPGMEASAKMKRDTSTMDSIELAIYKHNKAVDDSLARVRISPPLWRIAGEVSEYGFAE